ncbi:MAG: F0F1 ATP synthase subunit epsilon [Planctomycetota bacterium]
MSKTILCKVVTPSEKLLDEPITYASIPAWDGLFGVLPGRAPIVAKLGVGELTLEFPDTTAAGGRRSYFVRGGFAEMAGDELTILAEEATPASSLTVTDAEQALREAEALKPSPDAPDAGAEADRIRDERTAARARLRIAKASLGQGI